MKHIVITGASSGIGEALALHYAGADARLSLTARNLNRLDAVAARACEAGAEVVSAIADIADGEALCGVLQEFDRARAVDILIANAGILDGRRQDQQTEDAETARRVFQINLLGTLDTVHALLPAMQQRGAGHIVIVSSLAAFAPLADAPAYAASKAALLSYGLGLRDALAPSGVKVSVVTPGYVETNMTTGHIGAHPFKIGAKDAANRIIKGIAANKAIIGFPLPLYLASRLSAILPDAWRRRGNAGLRFHVDSPSDGQSDSRR